MQLYIKPTSTSFNQHDTAKPQSTCATAALLAGNEPSKTYNLRKTYSLQMQVQTLVSQALRGAQPDWCTGLLYIWMRTHEATAA